MNQTLSVIRRPQVRKITGLSDSTIYRMEVAGLFPKRRQIGSKAIGWLLHEIEDWVTSCVFHPKPITHFSQTDQ